MSILSSYFWLFIVFGTILYYVLPKKCQWMVLLVMSMLFYGSYGWNMIGFILVASTVVFGGAILIEKTEFNKKNYLKNNKDILDSDTKKIIRKKAERKEKGIFIIALVITLAIWAYLKYALFIVTSIYSAVGVAEIAKQSPIPSLSSLVLPLGISFYTFQAVGYLVDVYWGKEKACKNPLKFLLFISFFPQLIQGPINRFSQTGKQFFEEHKWDLRQIENAAIRILWGVFKKAVIANRAVLIVNEIFDNAGNYHGGIIVAGLLFYSVWQYADFSGGIDIVMGVAELFGINMMENFKRPYFSQSLGEFWRRWHISLGQWMKDYVFFPLALSKPMEKVQSFSKKHLGESITKVLPAAICNIIVFTLVGLWHGAYWHCIVWGLYNGLVLACSELLTEPFTKLRTALKIQGTEKWFIVFRYVRTFIIVNIGWFFDRCNTVGDSFTMAQNVFVRDTSGSSFVSFCSGLGIERFDLLIFAIAVCILFSVSVIQEKTNARIVDKIWNIPLIVRWIILYILIFIIVGLWFSVDGGAEFAYAQF